MSVHPYKTREGTKYQVRWREGGRVRTRGGMSKSDANALDVDVKARRQRGEALPRPGRETLGTAYAEWKRLRGPRLSTNTLNIYEAVWTAHVQDRFDHYRLSEWVSNPQLFEELLADMRARNIGNASQRKVLVVMSSVFAAAVQWKKVGINPVLAVPKPAGTRKRIPHPFPPVVIERIRTRMRGRKTKDRSGARAIADACLVVLMAYAGLRPGEALALTWGDIGARTIAVDKAVSVGEEASTKTGGARSVPMVQQLADDLADLRAARGTPAEDALVFPGADGNHWSPSEYNNWRSRVWKPVMKDLAEGKQPQPQLAKAVPYDCRGSFVSLHLRAGASPLEVAKWAGHSPKVMFDHYANVIEELSGEPILSAAEQIARARDAVFECEAAELDKLMADLIAHPTVSPIGGSIGTDDDFEAEPGQRRRAAVYFYAPR
ncbi:MAG TPA: site-specific integrase [Conexibacter sp.]|nr:site-specific integrase [Conexibacter sp.]